MLTAACNHARAAEDLDWADCLTPCALDFNAERQIFAQVS